VPCCGCGCGCCEVMEEFGEDLDFELRTEESMALAIWESVLEMVLGVGKG